MTAAGRPAAPRPAPPSPPQVPAPGPQPSRPSQPVHEPGRSEHDPEGPPPAADASPAALWRAAQDRLADRPSFVFLRHLRLDRIDGETAMLSIVPGQREVQHVATPQRLEIVAQILGDLRGRRTRIELQPYSAAVPPPEEEASPEPTAAGRSSQLDRRAALQLPLVRAALQAFPDAMLIDAREEGEPDPAAPPDDEAPASPIAPPSDPAEPDDDPDEEP